MEFTSWDDLTKKTPDIVIARCVTTANPTWIVNWMVHTDIEVISVLKGDTKPGTARMYSGYRPYQGERFLMFAWYQSNQVNQAYAAPETYRIVRIGRDFQMFDLTGKKLEEQIQMVLSNRLVDLNRELEIGAEEKKRLEHGLK
jgi:hypothetical protein